MIPQSCDTMVALNSTTSNGQTIFAKNSDRPAHECQPLVQRPRQDHPDGAITQCQFVSLPEVKTTYRHVGSRPYWCWGYEHGFNEHQVVIGNEGLASKLSVSPNAKLIGMEILRLGLERAKTAAEAVEVMTTIIDQYGQGKFENTEGVRTYDNGYIVADPHEAYAIETAGHYYAVKRIEKTLGISNVYSIETDWEQLAPNAESYATKQGWWANTTDRFNFADAYTANPRTEGSGAMRRIRSCTVLSQKSGAINAQTMIALLSDHGDGTNPGEPFQTDPNPGVGICVHAPKDGSRGNTAASLIADLCADGSRLPIYWCSFYSPCLGLFLPMFIEGTLPAVLAKGTGDPDDNSPWWQFHRLASFVRANPETNVPLVRQRWSDIQTILFETAHDIAIENRQLIDNDNAEQATQNLTNYMAQNVETMLNTLSDLLSELATPASQTESLPTTIKQEENTHVPF